ncbi:MAG: diaminopimelate epimerase [Bacteroidota bacterium]
MMNLQIAFTKASGAGNDFVLVNNFDGALRIDYPALARAVCDRHFGVGGDGLLILERSETADFAMKYFNADGSWGGMCGNGGRCIARFAKEEGIAGATQKFEAIGHLYQAEVGDGAVRLHMKDPVGFRDGLSLSIGGKSLEATFLDTGAPHVVIFDADVERTDVRSLGAAIRRDTLFQPGGTNVNFVRRTGPAAIEIRTYERGVEAETLACGTGTVASALIAAHRFAMNTPVETLVKSGERLSVSFRGSAGNWSHVVLEGSAYLLFAGTLTYQTEPPRIVHSS